MCILCVVQRWSRRVATMLPWLVIPLIVLWALSQLLPPALRFEITSPRLACVLVLLATLFWYEILMPYLSGWRARRSARLRERRRTEALELQKLRKTATRRCRNCNMPYREQNPGGGRFMCSFCGHISRRPALDLPDQIESPGPFNDVVGKNGWLCYADGSGNWAGSASKHWDGSDNLCSTKRSDSGVIFYACSLLSCFFSSVRWLRSMFYRFGSSREDGSSDSDHRGLSGKGEDGANFHESRGEKARRKAEEKRQARLEKEMLEAEEKKQRDEVARLVNERRRLRDEMLAAEMERSKDSAVDGDRGGRKEVYRRKKDRRKDKDKTSSKSNSDGEEPEKRASNGTESMQEFEKKAENEWRDSHKGVVNRFKSQSVAGVYGSKLAVNKNKYFDRMKGSFLYPSRGFSGPFFGRNLQNTTSVLKSSKPASGSIDHFQNPTNRREGHLMVHAVNTSASSVGGKVSETNSEQLAATNVQPKATVTKKSWQQLFTRSSVISLDANANSTNQGNPIGTLANQGDEPSKLIIPGYFAIDSQVDNRKFPTKAYPPTSNSITSDSFIHSLPDTAFPPLDEQSRSSVSEDADLFEDPCYVPDPISLLGPVSESLDNFASDSETTFSARDKNKGSPYLKNVLSFTDVNKPSPIEPPLPKLHFPEGINITSDSIFSTPKSGVSSNIHEQSTWQMWGSPLAQDRQSLMERPSSWFSPLAQGTSQQQVSLQSLSNNPVVQPISKSSNTLPGLSTQHLHTGKHEKDCGTFSPLCPSFSDNGIWKQSSPFRYPPIVNQKDHLFPIDLMDNMSEGEVGYSSPIKSITVPPFSAQPASCLSKDLSEEPGNLINGRENTGSFFTRGPEVPSVWSFI